MVRQHRYDVLVIGSGASGLGVGLDCRARQAKRKGRVSPEVTERSLTHVRALLA